jgi:polysaccharide deacetylase 2 family uncharacterized protein YibQ
MTEIAQKEVSADAAFQDVGRGRSRFGGFVRGAFWGVLLSGGVAVASSLLTPLPENLPGVGRVAVVGNTGTATSAPTVEPQTDPEPSVAVTEQTDAAQTDAEATEEGAQVTSAPATDVEGSPASEEGETTVGSDAGGDAASTAESEPASTETGASDEQETTQAEATEQTEAEAGTGAETETEASASGEGDDTGADIQVAALPDPVAETEPETQPQAVVTEPVEIKLSGPALSVNARTFEAPENAPLMAVILTDAGNGTIAPEALSLLTMPLTLSIRSDVEIAREIAEAARGAGHEVLAELPMMGGDGNALPKEGELSPNAPVDELQALTKKHLAALDMSIGATAPEGARLLLDQAALAAVLKPVGEYGFAYLDLRSAIGSAAERVAAETGMTYAASNRFVGAGATEDQIYQVLEGSAFQARRNGTTIVTVAASQDALKALVRWGLERGGQEVWFAPVSAVIKRQQAG